MGSLAVALPRPSPVSLSVCPVWYILTDLLCPQRWGLWSILTRPPCPSSSSWLCLSCALWGPFVWAAPVLGRAWRVVGSRVWGGGSMSPAPALPSSGFFELFVWGRPRVEFYIPRVLGVCRIYVHIGGGGWEAARGTWCCGQAWWCSGSGGGERGTLTWKDSVPHSGAVTHGSL